MTCRRMPGVGRNADDASVESSARRSNDLSTPVHVIVYATRPGGTTQDQDRYGGNPFATALIELSRRPQLNLTRLLPALRRLTHTLSGKHQTPDWYGVPANCPWSFPLEAGTRRERRIALVLVVSEYVRAGRLAGAAHDERRIASMLAGHGFTVVQGVPPDRPSLLKALRSFAMRSKGFDVALIYSTGHGVQLGDQVFLLPGNYPMQHGYHSAEVRRYGIATSQIASACQASQVNLILFAGCRSKVSDPPARPLNAT